MSIVKFYGDESFGGRQSGFQGCYAVAGYLAASEHWRAIADEWKAVLDTPPTIEYFHMSECYAAMAVKQDQEELGQFYGFSPKEAEQKLDALVAVLENNAISLTAIHSVTTWDIFQHVFEEAERNDIYGSPFYLCVMDIVDCCRSVFRKLDISPIPISFVFDERNDSHYLLRAWGLVKRIRDKFQRPEFNQFPDVQEHLKSLRVMGPISFSDDKQCIPLQCADLLAWHVRRNYIQPVEDHGRMRPQYKRLKENVAIYCSTSLSEDRARQERLKLWKDTAEFIEIQERKSK